METANMKTSAAWLHFTLLVVLVPFLLGCAEREAAPSLASESSVSTRSLPVRTAARPHRPGFEYCLVEIARTYESYGRVDDEFRLANADCRAAAAETKPDLPISSSTDLATHGRKLYRLYAKEQTGPGSYIVAGEANPIGQVVVKESWTLEPPREKGELFIMYKLDPSTPDTDEGWIYGTVTADGTKVISGGRVASCMSCHLEAPHDRLFGLPHERDVDSSP
jgi:hypothetical protein